MEIKEIYKKNTYMKDGFSFIGTLRNEKQFNIRDNVFFSINNHDIARGIVVGIELPLDENPSYSYKITVPDDLIRRQMSDTQEFYAIDENKCFTLQCDRIFRTSEEAKESALDNLERTFELQKKEIERYFNQFK